MKIIVALTHTNDGETFCPQVETIKALLTKVDGTLDTVDDNGKPVTIPIQYWTFTDIATPHQVEFIHIIPYQPGNSSNPYRPILPYNLWDLDGPSTVCYGPEDANVDIRRYFNWSLKRATHNKADWVIQVDDYTKFDPTELDLSGQYIFKEPSWGRIIQSQITKAGSGNLIDESQPFATSLTNLKNTLVTQGKGVG